MEEVRFTMRLRSILSLAGLSALLTAVPAFAANNPPMEYGMQQYWCRHMYEEKEYTRSLRICQAAVDAAKANAHASRNWLAYDGEAQSLEFVAMDDGALGHHHAAYQAALEAHKLSYYVVKNFGMDPDDVVTINARVSRLIIIETRELAYIRRGDD
jgi:hypothetical protein